ncbi:MAG: putative nucleotide-diphospho-sugar transferase, partial [Nitrosopumilus sp.]
MWIICAYYTKNTTYEDHSKKFVESLRQFNLSYDITSIDNRGDWYANMQYKPIFLKQMLEKHYPKSVVYVDVDATFCRHPKYFNKLEDTSEVNVAVHILDHSKYKRKTQPPEMLSGTIFLKNTKETNQIVNEWIWECKKDPKMWDQR